METGHPEPQALTHLLPDSGVWEWTVGMRSFSSSIRGCLGETSNPGALLFYHGDQSVTRFLPSRSSFGCCHTTKGKSRGPNFSNQTLPPRTVNLEPGGFRRKTHSEVIH